MIFYQIEEFIAWKSDRCSMSQEDKNVLYDFARRSSKKDVKDISVEDIVSYIEHLKSIHQTQHPLDRAIITIRSFLRYFRARKYISIKADEINVDLTVADATIVEMQKNKKIGRPLDLATREKVKLLRSIENPPSFRQIARVIGKDVSTVHKHYHDSLQAKA